MAFQAQDTFVAEIDGSPVMVAKGQVFADNHPVVKLDEGRGHLFRPLDVDEPAKAPTKPQRGGR
jgi:hypothetical protein